MAETLRYQFNGGLPTRVLFGLGAARAASLALGLAGAAVALYLRAFPALPIAVLALAGAWTFAPVRGRPACEWAPPLLRHAWAVLSGTRTWHAGLAETAPPATGGRLGLKLPAELAGLSLWSSAIGAVEGGVAVERRPGGVSLTLVYSVSGLDHFGLLDEAEQSRLVGLWGDVLSTMGPADGLRRLCWVERAMPDPGGSGLAWMSARWAKGSEEARADYRRLVEAVGVSSTIHGIHVGAQVEIATRKVPDALAQAGPTWRALATRLSAAGLVATPLSPVQLGLVIRAHYGLAPVRVDPKAAGAASLRPQSRRVAWDHLRADDSLHRAFLVSAWPRVSVGPSWLAPLLLAAPGGAARTVAVHLEAVDPAVAQRKARAARLGAAMDETQRARWGFLSGAAHIRGRDEAEARDDELVSGFAQHRVAAVVVVSGDDPKALDGGCREVRAAAGAARIDLRPLHGDHAEAVAAALPLCRLRFGGEA